MLPGSFWVVGLWLFLFLLNFYNLMTQYFLETAFKSEGRRKQIRLFKYTFSNIFIQNFNSWNDTVLQKTQLFKTTQSPKDSDGQTEGST